MPQYDETDFSTEEDEWEEDSDWDIETSSNQDKTIELSNGKKLKAYRLSREGLSKEELSIVEKNVLSLIEKNLVEKEELYKKEGYNVDTYPETDHMATMDRISLLEKRMNSLLSWLKSRKHGSPYQGYPHEEKKLNLRDAVIEKLSKEPFWDNASPEFREKVTREEMLRIALGTREQQNLTMEKAVLSERSLIDDIDDSYKAKKCFLCGWTDSLMTWTDFLEHLGRVHTETADKYYWLIQSVEPARWTGKGHDAATSKTLQLPESSKMPHTDIEFSIAEYIKGYGKDPSKLSKEELSKFTTEFEELSRQYPNTHPRELARMILLRRHRE